MNEERYYKDSDTHSLIDEWDRQYDYGVAPLPWNATVDGIQDALGRRVFVAKLNSNTRGYVSANYDNIDAVVKKMNCIEMTLDQLQTSVVEWADEAFPNRTPQSGFLKMYEELGEVLRGPSDRHEWADVFIMLLDIAKAHGVDDLTTAIQEKLEINKKRKWEEGALGVMQHVPASKTAVVVILNGPHAGEMEIVTNPRLPNSISMADEESGCVFVYTRVVDGDTSNAYALNRVIQ